ncbi:hypothetical protein Tco_1483918 [Tanacetum coccineum]
MAEENVPTPAPTRSDEHILPFNAWLPVRKSNYLLDLQKLQKNPIFRISVDILQNTNFFRAFTASANALEITPRDSAHPFVSPLAGEQVMDFVNELGYPEEIHFASKMHVNNLYQPWRAIMSLINQTNVDYAELLWEEFVQAIKIFFTHQANLNTPTKKSTPRIISYYRFTKLIIYYLGSRYNIHRRPAIHVTGDDFLLGNLKFVPKGEKDEVFGKPIPNVLITDAIRNSEYYQQYLEMVARKPTIKEEPQSAPEPQIEDDEYNLQRGVTQSLPVVEGKGKGIYTDEQVTQSLLELQKPKEKSTTDQYIFQRRAPVTEEASTGPSAGSGNTLESRPSPDEDQARPNPGQSHVALAGPNPEPMYEDFIAMVYPKGHKSLKHTTDEHVFLENLPSSSGTLSSMKNLDDAFTYGDQFLYNKSTEEEPDKANVETKVKSYSSSLFNSSSSFHSCHRSHTAKTNPALAARVSALEQICANLAKKNKQQDQTSQALSSRIFTLKNHDLYSKIDKYINENVKEVVQDTLKALVRKRFRELIEFEMKEILRDRIKGSGQALSISKMKVARYHDFGLELLVPEHIWIDDVCTYDISASYVDIEKVAVRSSLRSLKPKRTIESRGKRSSINLIRTLFHITCSSHNVKIRVIIRVLRIILVVLPEHPSDTYVFTMKMEILLEPTLNKLMVGEPSQDLEVQVKMGMEIPCSSRVYFITACSYSTDTSNHLMKAQVYVSNLSQL